MKQGLREETVVDPAVDAGRPSERGGAEPVDVPHGAERGFVQSQSRHGQAGTKPLTQAPTLIN